MTVFDHTQVTLCGWQDVEIQWLSHWIRQSIYKCGSSASLKSTGAVLSLAAIVCLRWRVGLLAGLGTIRRSSNIFGSNNPFTGVAL